MVLLPAKVAGCSLAESITAEDVRNLRKKYPGIPVVTYVNTYADVKAETDVCCTSGNASQIVQSLDSEVVIFLPDEYLAKNVARETGKRIIFPSKDHKNKPVDDNANLEYELIGWHGKCEVHDQFKVEDIENARKQFPDVVVLSHPECPPDVVEASDFSGSTSRMIQYVKDSQADQYMLLTECSMGDNIIAENPNKEVIRLCSIRCPHMNEITLEDTLEALRHNKYQIEVEEEIRIRAKKSIDRMLMIG
jgi:quinolinate synthase